MMECFSTVLENSYSSTFDYSTTRYSYSNFLRYWWWWCYPTPFEGWRRGGTIIFYDTRARRL